MAAPQTVNLSPVMGIVGSNPTLHIYGLVGELVKPSPFQGEDSGFDPPQD